jgi:hypothetical protein
MAQLANPREKRDRYFTGKDPARHHVLWGSDAVMRDTGPLAVSTVFCRELFF